MSEETLQVQLIPAEKLPEEVREMIPESGGRTVSWKKKLFFCGEEECIVCPDNESGRAMMNLIGREPSNGENIHPKDLFFRQLLDGKTEKINEEQLKSFGVRFGRNRNVILFTAGGKTSEPLNETFRNVAPTEKDDIRVPIRYDTVALIKANQSDEGEEAYEYACAAAETLESEWGISIRAGIGNCVDDWGLLAGSCREAESALKTASRFHLAGSVFRYRELLTERILDGIPSEKRSGLKKEALSEETRELLNPEMLETIRIFFRNDLNLSTTSRQLFIHRNTLQYRLDKIRKATGLDLRKFTDAAAFYLLMTIPEE